MVKKLYLNILKGLGDNPYEKTLKDLKKLPMSQELTFEWKRLYKQEKRALKKAKKSKSYGALLERAGKSHGTWAQEAGLQEGGSFLSSSIPKEASGLTASSGLSRSKTQGELCQEELVKKRVARVKSDDMSSVISTSSMGSAYVSL